MGWYQWLTVALKSAEALSYLHRAASPPILHQDVKSINILPSMIQVENELREILQNLHGVGTYALAEGTTVVIQSASEVGAVTMENNEYVIHSYSSPWKVDSQIYGISRAVYRDVIFASHMPCLMTLILTEEKQNHYINICTYNWLFIMLI